MYPDKYSISAFISTKRSAIRFAVAAGAIAGAIATTGMAFAQATQPPALPPATPEAAALEPVAFTTQQVSAGRSTFGSSCAGCHGETLAGLDGGPPLVGDSFARWYTGPVSALYDFILTRMPADAPGTLQPRQALGLVAFILERNGFLPGDVALPEDPAALALIGFRQ